MPFAPIVLFVYNRPDHTIQAIESLKKNEGSAQSDLYIFCDGPKSEKDAEDVNKVRQIADSANGFRKVEVFKEKVNRGLANSIISGVGKIINNSGKVIVLEDDLVLSPNFLSYMNQGLELYENDAEVFSLSGYRAPIKIPHDYTSDIFVFNRINSWGWATWKNRWESVDWQVSDFNKFISSPSQRRRYNQGGEESSVVLLWQMQGKIDSWAIRFNYACFKQGLTNIYPVKSLVKNIGADGSGVHVSKTNKYRTDVYDGVLKLSKRPKQDQRIIREYLKLFKKNPYRKTINYLHIILYQISLLLKRNKRM